MAQTPSNDNLIIPENLLTELDEFIGSKRLKSRIVSLKDLLDVLWKRNVLLTEDGKKVEIIFTKYPNKIVDYYRGYLSHPPKTSYEPTSKSSISYYFAFQRQKKQIYDLITSNVSAKYCEFGRRLELFAEMENIEKNSRMNGEGCETITYRILTKAEEKHKHNTPDIIMMALKAIKRNDIARQMNEELNRFSHVF